VRFITWRESARYRRADESVTASLCPNLAGHYLFQAGQAARSRSVNQSVHVSKSVRTGGARHARFPSGAAMKRPVQIAGATSSSYTPSQELRPARSTTEHSSKAFSSYTNAHRPRATSEAAQLTVNGRTWFPTSEHHQKKNANPKSGTTYAGREIGTAYAWHTRPKGSAARHHWHHRGAIWAIAMLQ
jgi:hypothetical protein